MRSRKGRVQVMFFLGLLGLALAVFFFLRLREAAAETESGTEAAETMAPYPPEATADSDLSTMEIDKPGVAKSSDAPALPSARDWVEAFRDVPVADRADWIRRWWMGAKAEFSEGELTTWILAFLGSGADLPTGLGFRVGPGGVLETAPSLRVQALDWLGAVDPVVAANNAEAIFGVSTLPDEWAIALRNYGRSLDAPSQDSYYADRVTDLLARSDWQAQPTGGFLEAFDAAVYSGAPEAAASLLELSLTASHPGTRKAASMALDNLAGDDPLTVAKLVNIPDSPIAELPTFRASLVSRLDPRDEAHVSEIERYLLEVPHGADELDVFAKTFPNLNDFASHYLLTEQPGRNLYEMAQIDLAAYRLVQALQADPLYGPRMDTLVQIETRLRGFLESAVEGGMLKPEDLP